MEVEVVETETVHFYRTKLPLLVGQLHLEQLQRKHRYLGCHQ